MVTPTAIEAQLGLDLHSAFIVPCYAACLLAICFVAAATLGVLVQGLNRCYAGLKAAVTGAALLLMASGSVAFGQSTSMLAAEELRHLLHPATPLTLPDDVVVIPYDGQDPSSARRATKVLIPYQKYLELRQRAKQEDVDAARLAGTEFALSGSEHRLSLTDDDHLQVHGHIQIDVFRDTTVQVPFELGGGVLTNATVDGQPARIEVSKSSEQSSISAAPAEEGSSIELHVSGPGTHVFEFSVRLRLERSGGWRIAAGRLPAAPASVVTIHVPSGGTEVRLEGVKDQEAFETSEAGQEIQATLDPRKQFRVRWRPRVESAVTDRSLTVESTALLDIQEGRTARPLARRAG